MNSSKLSRITDGICIPSPVSFAFANGKITATAERTTGISNSSYLGAIIYVSVLGGGTAMTAYLDGFDASAGTTTAWGQVATLGSITAAGTYAYHVGIGSGQTAAAFPLPATFAVRLVSATTTASTCTAGYQFVPFPIDPFAILDTK